MLLRLMTGLAAATALTATPAITANQTAEAIGFICSAQRPDAARQGELKIIEKVGIGGWPVRTTSREAQAWFNYGAALYHAFYHEDAKLAFRKAAELDPSCAMCAWGEAWAAGSVINYGISKEETAAALAIAQRAAGLAKDGPALEQALTTALVNRYTPGRKREKEFAEALAKIVVANPQNLMVADIAAHQWLVADDAGKSVALLESILGKSPDDTAAIHYYIHATEWLGEPAKAVPYAERLGELAPNASHLVHMPAHTFFRVGRYEDSSFVNAAAVAADIRYGAAVESKGTGARLFYYGHNVDFGLGGALMSGDEALALKFADHIQGAYLGAAGTGDDFAFASGETLVAYGLYAPGRLMLVSDPGSARPEYRMMRHYARGEVFARQGDLQGLAAEIRLMRGRDPKARVAKAVLEGRKAMLEKNTSAAARAFAEAARIQEKEMGGYMDPPPWWYPARRSLAAAHLAAGRHAEAQTHAERVLDEWSGDAVTMLILSRALAAQGKAAEAATWETKARSTWRGDLSKVDLRHA